MMILRPTIFAVVISVAFTVATASLPAQAETVVTTYVVKTQEERKSTRWTLTEWLRIKERMKMMDVWLAMFSDPQKDREFRPELNLVYQQNRGTMTLGDGEGESSSGPMEGYSIKAQFWLTNLISSTTGAAHSTSILALRVGRKTPVTLSRNHPMKG